MMKNAYVLINCKVGYEKPVFEELKQLDNVTDVELIPDVIPKEKKPLQPPSETDEEDEEYDNNKS
jgi:hypothetical protein